MASDPDLAPWPGVLRAVAFHAVPIHMRPRTVASLHSGVRQRVVFSFIQLASGNFVVSAAARFVFAFPAFLGKTAVGFIFDSSITFG